MKNIGIDRVPSTLETGTCSVKMLSVPGVQQPAVIVFGRGPGGLRSPDQTVQHQAGGLRGENDARTGMPFGIPKGAMCVQRFDDSREFCNSHYLSHFAAFFIDARTKRSVVESFALF